MVEKVNRSTAPIRVPLPIADQIKEFARLFRENKLTPESLQALIDRIDLADEPVVTPLETVSNHPASSPSDPGLLEVLARLEQKIDRLSQHSHPSSAPAEILTLNQLIERSGIPFGQLAAQGRNSGQPLESILAQRTGYRYLGNGTFARQR